MAEAGAGRLRVLFYVQHLLGTGHLRRIALLAQALAGTGVDACVVSGGAPLADLEIGAARLVQLPALKARDMRFSALVTLAGRAPDDAFRQQRCRQLLDTFASFAPDALVIEAFPFGRFQLCFELDPLLAAAQVRRRRPALLCSVRDIVQAARKPDRQARTLDYLNRAFDVVLVHGDPGFVPLEASFPPVHELQGKLLHTGFVVAARRPCAAAGVRTDEIIVSAGGGAAAGGLYDAALAAALLRLGSHRWRLLVGAGLARPQRQRLQQAATDTVRIEPARTDFVALLGRAAACVSQAGYNTVMDILMSGARAVVVPFEGDGETEQLMRAERLVELGRVQLVRESALSGATLAAAVERALGETPAPLTALNLGGISNSVRIIRDYARRARAATLA